MTWIDTVYRGVAWIDPTRQPTELVRCGRVEIESVVLEQLKDNRRFFFQVTEISYKQILAYLFKEKLIT